MTTKEELAETIATLVMALAEESRWPVQRYQMQSVIQQTLNNWENDGVSQGILDWQNSVDAKIHELIKDWEYRMPEDNTLYSLGLRRALDIVRGLDVETS